MKVSQLSRPFRRHLLPCQKSYGPFFRVRSLLAHLSYTDIGNLRLVCFAAWSTSSSMAALQTIRQRLEGFLDLPSLRNQTRLLLRPFIARQFFAPIYSCRSEERRVGKECRSR